MLLVSVMRKRPTKWCLPCHVTIEKFKCNCWGGSFHHFPTTCTIVSDWRIIKPKTVSITRHITFSETINLNLTHIQQKSATNSHELNWNETKICALTGWRRKRLPELLSYYSYCIVLCLILNWGIAHSADWWSWTESAADVQPPLWSSFPRSQWYVNAPWRCLLKGVGIWQHCCTCLICRDAREKRVLMDCMTLDWIIFQ